MSAARRSRAPKRCPAQDGDYSRCELPAGHTELHMRRCNACSNGHHWPRPEQFDGPGADHTQALLMDERREGLTNA